MNTKVYKGTIDRWLDYRIEEVREDVTPSEPAIFTLETKHSLAPDTVWEGHGAFGKLEHAMEHLFTVREQHVGRSRTQIPTKTE